MQSFEPENYYFENFAKFVL